MDRIPIQNRTGMRVQVALLRTLYVGGALSMALLAPKTTRLFSYLDRGKKGRKKLHRRIGAAKGRLRQRGLIRDAGGRFELTEKGRQSIERILMREYKIPEQVLWDGKWRILFFDIHEKRRRIRLALRHLLKGAGFVRLQDSVWVHPYPCDEFVALVRAHLASGVGELRAITADALESDKSLRHHFRLS